MGGNNLHPLNAIPPGGVFCAQNPPKRVKKHIPLAYIKKSSTFAPKSRYEKVLSLSESRREKVLNISRSRYKKVAHY